MCTDYMVPPIKLCTNGHSICSKCRGRVKRCPTCRAKFSETRCLALEDIARRLKYPCANRQSGCHECFSIEHIAKHHAVCVYGKIKCPFHFIKTCSWNGLKSEFKEHVQAAHPKSLFREPTFFSPALHTSVAIISCFGELFTYFKQKKDGRYNVAVQLIGTSSEASKYRCEFTLRAANCIEEIKKIFLVQGYSEDIETFFNSKKCLNVDEETIKLFVVNRNLNLTVTLSRV